MPSEAVDRLVARLHEDGTLGIEVVAEGEVHELIAYFEDATPGPDALLPFGADAEPVAVPDVDWVARFREEFRGARAGPFRIRPVWRAQGDGPGRPGEVPLLVDPGGAFGTGTHESTRLCLEELAGTLPGALVVDVGCGTGLLAIAALRLGWQRALAIDIDAAAVREAGRHAALNRVAPAILRGDGATALAPGRAELVLANLARDLLLRHRDDLVAAVAPGGTLVLSGLLRDDVPGVRSAFDGLGPPQPRFEGEWAALRFRRAA